MNGFDQCVSRAGSVSNSAHRGAAAPGKSTLVESSLPRNTRDVPAAHVQLATSAHGPTSAVEQPANDDSGAIQRVAATGIAGGGGPLPYRDAIQGLFGRHDVSGIEAHVGGTAETANRAIGAEGYATGHHVAFAAAPTLHTAAHEAAHVVQQRGGVQLKDGVGEASDHYERHADRVADAVVAGRSAEPILDEMAKHGGGGSTRAVQRDTGPGSRSAQQQQAQQSSRVDRLIHLLTATPAVTGPEDYDEAFAFLSGLTMPDLLATMSDVADRGLLPQLIARSGSAAAYGRARLLSALHAVELARAAPSSVSNERLHQAGVELDQIPHDQQLQVLEYLLHHGGAGVTGASLLEGVLAMRAEQPSNASTASGGGTHGHSAAGRGDVGPAGAGPAGAAPAAGITGPPAPVEPGPWAPPGDEPIPLYIGNQAHKRIAEGYRVAHARNDVRLNSFPISSLLQLLIDLGHKANAGALNDTELGRVPDIANLTRLHLYEIKPVAAQALGAAKAALCVGIFSRAGIAMTLGPTVEPGTSGGIPAPGGVYMFWSPEPGVIVYQYRKGRLVPVPVPEPEPVKVRRWRFELQPMTRQQQQAVATLTVGGALLLMAMILLSPAGI
jgi:hypothetical protein